MMLPITAPFLLLLSALLTGCGYHLVGNGNAIPGASDTIIVLADTPLGQQAKTMLLQQMSEDKRYHFVANTDHPHATLHIQNLNESWSTQGFDNNGIANRYQMILHGNLWLQPSANTQDNPWRSGTIQQQEDLFASGGPVAIEANRSQLRRQLLQRWVQRAINRLRSGF